MSKRILQVECAGISNKDEELLISDLRQLFPTAASSSVLQFSDSPPTWVQIIADGPTWSAVFKIAATAYLAQLGKHMADSTWEARKKARPMAIRASGGAIASLQRLYSILRAQKDRISRKFSVSVALPAYGQWDVGTRVSLEDPNQFVDEMAIFVSRVDGISHAVRVFQDAGCVPVLSIGCALSEDGFQLTWVERAENAQYTWDFNEEGIPTAPRRRRA